MKSKITRREALYLGAGLLAGSAVPTLLADRKTLGALTERFQFSLPVPPVLTPVRMDSTTDYYEVHQREAQFEVLPGSQTTIWGYEGILPGPTIRPNFPRPSIGNINGKEFDPDLPIASPGYDDFEVWHVRNNKFLGLLGLVHPVHIHLVNFQILERNGGPALPHERGWKDTVAIDKAEDIKLLMRFDGYKGRYLMHCHNLEHEDHSMMARFDVV